MLKSGLLLQRCSEEGGRCTSKVRINESTQTLAPGYSGFVPLQRNLSCAAADVSVKALQK